MHAIRARRGAESPSRARTVFRASPLEGGGVSAGTVSADRTLSGLEQHQVLVDLVSPRRRHRHADP